MRFGAGASSTLQPSKKAWSLNGAVCPVVPAGWWMFLFGPSDPRASHSGSSWPHWLGFQCGKSRIAPTTRKTHVTQQKNGPVENACGHAFLEQLGPQGTCTYGAT